MNSTEGTERVMETKGCANSADVCRANGWSAGTRLVGDEGYGPTVMEITAIGESGIFGRTISHNGKYQDAPERCWTLSCREWHREANSSILSNSSGSTVSECRHSVKLDMSEPMRDEVAAVLQGPTETIWDALQRNHSQLKAALSANRENDAEIARLKLDLSESEHQVFIESEAARHFQHENISLRASGGEQWIEIKEGCEMPAVGVRVPIWTTTTGLQIAAYEPSDASYPWPDGDGRWPARVVSHWKNVAPPTLTREKE